MAATPKPARKMVKSEMKAMKSAVSNPKHKLSPASKKMHLKEMAKEGKSRHTSPAIKMAKFKKKHPGDVYEA